MPSQLFSSASATKIFKTYVSRPETDDARIDAMNQLGNGLIASQSYDDALPVREAQLSMLRRIGASVEDHRVAKGNLAGIYQILGRTDEAVRMGREVYLQTLQLYGMEASVSLEEGSKYASSLLTARRFAEPKALLEDTIPIARRVLGERDHLTVQMRSIYARALSEDPNATLADLHEAVNTLEEIEGIVQRVYGGAHPFTEAIVASLQIARGALRRLIATVAL